MIANHSFWEFYSISIFVFSIWKAQHCLQNYGETVLFQTEKNRNTIRNDEKNNRHLFEVQTIDAWDIQRYDCAIDLYV